MANDISSRSWFIDTASASTLLGRGNNQVYVKFIEVVGGAAGTVGNPMASITDQNSKSIVTALYQTANVGEIQTYNLENWFENIIVPSLGTGVTLRIHVK
jgi:uncharacterized protein (DUF697 family)